MSATGMFSHTGDAVSCEEEVPSPLRLPAFQAILLPERQPTRWIILDVLELQVREIFRTSSRTEAPLLDEVLSLGEHPISGAALGHLSLCRWAECPNLRSIADGIRESRARLGGVVLRARLKYHYAIPP